MNNKAKYFILSAVVLFAMPLGALAGSIGSAKDFAAFVKACNEGGNIYNWAGADSVVVLSADIDLAKEKKLPQIAAFAGKFDGKGHKICNWKAQGGIFKDLLKGAVVKNLVIDASCSMKAVCKGEEFFAGFIADQSSGTIQDCTNYGSISYKCNYTSNNSWVGGIVGLNRYVVYRCANHGEISAYSISAERKGELTGYFGGVAGGSKHGKCLSGACIARCTNSGNVKVSTDYPVEAVGGIAGTGGAASIKYCVNKGAVSAQGIRPEEIGNIENTTRIGGIAGFTKGDVTCSDNFGKVSSSGFGTCSIGGIVGMPHTELCVLDCVNRGSVSASNEDACHVGGVVGVIGRPVHVRRCKNYGSVRFEGISQRSRSTAAGIVGQIYCPRTSKAGAYVRNCANFGDIYASAGGNSFDSGSSNCIHAAGVVAYMDTREGYKAFLKDCSNHGKVTSDAGRRGNIAASVRNITTGGSYPDDEAVPSEPLADGSNIYGRVTTTDGKPLEGIVVTDGEQCVKTDAQGNYKMTSDLQKAHFVYVSMPATVEIPVTCGVPQFFRRIARNSKAVKADFSFAPREKKDSYTLIMVGDPQVRPYDWGDNSMEVWDSRVSKDIEAFRASTPGDVYSINLGDLVYNYMYAWDDYLDVAASVKCPTFNVIGNHDYDQQTVLETELGNMFFENYVGPEHYSFDLGDIHFIVANVILYDRASGDDRYGYGLDERTMTWLENDLANVSKDKIVMTCSHGQLFKKKGDTPNGSHSAYYLNYQRYLDVLKQYKAVYSWCGHYHGNFYYNYANHIGQTKHGAPNIQCISVGRCNGALRFNKPISSNGEPQGYMVVNVKGNDIDWYYKAVGHGKDYQMRTFSPERTGDGSVKADIWNWSEGWSTPKWYENGECKGEMTSISEIDPDYQVLYDGFTNKRDRKYCKPHEACMWRVVPSEGVKSGEIRVTDLFGNTYTSTVSWQ